MQQKVRTSCLPQNFERSSVAVTPLLLNSFLYVVPTADYKAWIGKRGCERITDAWCKIDLTFALQKNWGRELTGASFANCGFACSLCTE